MTRETKIGLLVGLAFIVVIGILLSDHFRGASDMAPAGLDKVGASARQAVNVPGSSWTNPPAVSPVDVSPHAVVQTPPDIETPRGPVVVDNNPPQNQQAITGTPLAEVAKQQGEEIVSADNSGQLPKGITQSADARSYVAQPGDTLSRMAAKLLGANNRQNRQALIAANPSLENDPNMIVAGQSYAIPAAATSPPASSIEATSGTSTAAPPSSQSGQWSYTVKPGDTLWGIATGQLGDPGTIDAIKEMNQDLLHGGNTLRPGMKLRLPGHPVAVAD